MVIEDETTDVLLVIPGNGFRKDVLLNVQVDTGAAASLMADKFYNLYFKGSKLLLIEEALNLVPSLATNLQDYQKHRLIIKGVFMAPVKEVKNLEGLNMEINKKIVPFLITTEGANIILGRSSTGRRGLNILRHFKDNLDRDANDTCEMDQLGTIQEVEKNRGFYSALAEDSDGETESEGLTEGMPGLLEIDSDDEDDPDDEYNVMPDLRNIDDDSDDEDEVHTKVNETKKRPEENQDCEKSIEEQTKEFYKKVLERKEQPVSQVQPETITLNNPIPPCPISDEHYEALSQVHNTRRGHNKKTLWKHVNRGRAEDDLITMSVCQQFSL